jgi:hypothetical protein
LVLAAGSFPVPFGNFRRGCELIDRGNLLNNSAIKFPEIAS